MRYEYDGDGARKRTKKKTKKTNKFILFLANFTKMNKNKYKDRKSLVSAAAKQYNKMKKRIY